MILSSGSTGRQSKVEHCSETVPSLNPESLVGGEILDVKKILEWRASGVKEKYVQESI